MNWSGLENRYINLYIGDKLHYRKQIDALPIAIKGFEFLDLFICQNNGDWYFGEQRESITPIEPLPHKGMYAIACLSGDWIAIGDNPEDVYYKAKQALEKRGKDTIINLLNKRMQELGLSQSVMRLEV